jgi:hypothetical protein
MPGGRVAVGQQALAHEQRRDAVAEADLDRPGRPLPQDPAAQRLALGGADGQGGEPAGRAVGARHHLAVAQEPLAHPPHPPQRRLPILRARGAHPGNNRVVRPAPVWDRLGDGAIAWLEVRMIITVPGEVAVRASTREPLAR